MSTCHPCVWIRTAILCAIPAGTILLLWHLIGVWLIIIPALIAVGTYMVKDARKVTRKARQERIVYRDADSPLLCLPCEREGKAIRAENVLAISGYEIPCCTSHLRVAETRSAILGGVNRGR